MDLRTLLVMMAALDDTVLDPGLQYLEDNGSRLDICSQEPANYTEATSTYTLGNKTAIVWTGPADRTGGGRKTQVDAISGGSVTGTGTASHWAISKVSAVTAKLASGSLTAPQAVTSGNTFSTAAMEIGFADPT